MISKQRLIELSASVVTLSGQAIGSTSFPGALCYALATVIWVWLTIRQKLWGLMPLNVASALVTIWTLWHFI